jgi:predicted PurR-regulated permease PerM
LRSHMVNPGLLWMVLAALGRVQNVITASIVAALFAYAIFPGVRFLSARMPRLLAVTVVYVIALVAIGFAAAYLAPTIATEAIDLSRMLPSALHAGLRSQVAHPGASWIIDRFPPEVRTVIVQNATRVAEIGGAIAGYFGERVVGVLRGTVTFVVDTFLVLTLAFFFITDAERIRTTALRLVPREGQGRLGAARFIDESDRVISAFVRGQLFLAAVTGVAVTVILVIMRVPYAALLGVFAGVASVVPIVGELIGAVATFVVAIITVAAVKAFIVLALFVAVFEVQGRVLVPIFLGKSVGVSPLVIFIAILMGAETFGIVGMLLAVPIAAILRVALDQLAPRDALVEVVDTGADGAGAVQG